jgi:hypothetical protein
MVRFDIIIPYNNSHIIEECPTHSDIQDLDLLTSRRKERTKKELSLYHKNKNKQQWKQTRLRLK